MKLVNKVTLFNSITSGLILLLGSVMIFFFFDKVVKDYTYDELLNDARVVERQIDLGIDVGILSKDKDVTINKLKHGERFRREPIFGQIIVFEKQRPSRPGAAPIEKEIEKGEVSITTNIRGDWYQIVCAKKKITPSELFLTSFTSIFILLIILLLILSVGNRFLFNKLFQPFYESLKQLRNFNLSEKTNVSFKESDIEEFSFLNEKLQFFIEKTQQDYAQLKEFSENASHELKTPLAIIKSKLNLLQQSENLSENDLIRIEEIQNTLQKANKLNQTLLLLNKIDNYEFKETESIAVDVAVNTVLNEFSEMIDLKKIILHKKLTEFSIIANPYLIDLLLKNIIQNAIKHNYVGGKLSIVSEPKRLLIINDGEAIDVEASQYFQRFKKGSQKLQSTGLGLAIVKRICEVENFEISYINSCEEHRIEIFF
jgi:signal transduction histidine kinase